ncbi:hypothetical protein [Williamsia sp. CHRR-6]|uniref:hypothetical protein n=1 Tax=Williamsia sp. CHRR-6 TaxID=2835871 RepID=UPI001BD9CDE9|nr:hypothetical protein [Williamsia sp. CHRR-6]MBT0566871.1 hypothetical protein [Williamsia sp. CHRR-6]
MRRLEAADFTYWFMDRGLGWSVVLQLIWTFPTRIPAAAIEAMNADLARGPLHRRVHEATVPIARPRWAHSACSPAAMFDPGSVVRSQVLRWAADEMYAVRLDPRAGRQWRLRAIDLADGGTALSLCTLHLVADGQVFVASAADAMAGRSADPLPIAPPDSAAVRAADAIDVVRQLAAVATGVGRAVYETGRRRMLAARGAAADAGLPPDPRSGRTVPAARAPAARTRWAIVSVPAVQWKAVAQSHGGTVNVLFVAVIAGALRSRWAHPADEPLKVGIPVSQRTGATDERANATAGVSVYLADEVVAGGDLTAVRTLCKQAYARLAAGHRPPMIHLQPLMHVLPTSVVVKAATAGTGIPDALTSNIGSYGEDVLTLGGVRADGLAFRGDAQGVDPHLPYRFGDGLQSWFIEAGDTVTFSVAAFDESVVVDDDELRAMLAAELDAWGLPHRIW